MLFAARQLPVYRLSHPQSEQRRAHRDEYRNLSRIDVRFSRIDELDLPPLARGFVLENHARVHRHYVPGNLVSRHDDGSYQLALELLEATAARSSGIRFHQV